MTDHSSDEPAVRTQEKAQERRVARADWRLGGRTVLRWRDGLLGIALVSLGVGIVLGAAVRLVWQSPWAAGSATLLVLIGMLVPVVLALRVSRPVGLLRLRALDLLFGVALGLVLRLVQGWVEVAGGGSGALPTYPLVDGRLSSTWLLTDVAVPGVVAPVVEEFFFRAVVLIAMYTLLRRPFGAATAGAVAVLASAGVFVLVHGIGGAAQIDHVVALGFLGLVGGLLVVLTGRIWGAVLLHLVFNASYVALALAGTLLG